MIDCCVGAVIIKPIIDHPAAAMITATCERHVRHAVKLGDMIGNRCDHHVSLTPLQHASSAPINMIIKEVDHCGVAPKLWDAAIALIEYIVTHCDRDASYMRGKRVIELGAGTGALGIVCAALGADVVITDGPMGYISLINDNVALNTPSLQRQRRAAAVTVATTQTSNTTTATTPTTPAATDSRNTETKDIFSSPASPATTSRSNDSKDKDDTWHVQVEEFFWSSDVTRFAPPFDFIIGTDIVYEPVAHQPLMDALLALATPSTQILIANRFRTPSDWTFWRKLRPYFSVDTLALSEKYTALGNTLYDIRRRTSDLERTQEDIDIDNAAADGRFGDPTYTGVVPAAPPI